MGGSPRLVLPLLAAGLLAASAPSAPAAGPPPAEAPRGGAPAPRTRIVVGADPAYPPYEFLDRSGQPAGFNVDLTRAIAEVMGIDLEFRFGSWSEMRAALARGEIDLLQGISWSAARARVLDFAPPHALVHHAIFARRGTPPVASLDALRGKRVVVFGGGILDEILTARGFGPDLIRTATPADALRLLASGQGDYVAVAELPGLYLIRELGLTNVVPVAQNVTTERYGYAVRRGDTELLSRFSEGLAILKQTGRYEAIRARWLGVLEQPRTPWPTVARWVAMVALPLLLVLGGTVLWSRSLQGLVAQRTASLAREMAERERAAATLLLQQRQLVQADKLAALGVLVAGVAHEVNNPNGFILLNMPILRAAFLDALESLDAGGATDDLALAGIPYARMRVEIPLMLDEMAAGSRRIKRIVEDLKDFARREDSPRLAPIDLNDVARAAVRLVDARIRHGTGRFEVSLADGLPRVRADAQRIEQVVVNLLLNACEALPGPERGVALATRADPAAGQVVLEVRDEGVGIRPEDLPRVTDPFFTTKRETGGTGLGLSVSAGIVEEHGGALGFASTPGVGTVATLRLPAIPEASA